jgi:hypothetical protein
MDPSLLSTYLGDHLAVATAGQELARRFRGAHRDDPLAATFVREFEDERIAVVHLHQRLGVKLDRIKAAGGWLAEKAGRLKLNGRLLSRSPLSDVTELEGLTVIVTAMRGFWRGIDTALGDDPRVAGMSPGSRAAANERRLGDLDDARDAAVRRALAT